MYCRKIIFMTLVLFFLTTIAPTLFAHEKETGEEILQTPAPVTEAVTPTAEAPTAPTVGAPKPQTPETEEERIPQVTEGEHEETERLNAGQLKKIKGSFTLNTGKQKGYLVSVFLTVFFLVLFIVLQILF